MAENRDNADEPIPSPDLDAAAELVEVYETDNEMAARAVIDEILGPAGIDAFLHDRRSRAIVAPAAMPGEVAVAVPAHLVARAQEALREARRDGFLTEDGQLAPVESGDDDEGGETGTA